LSYADLSYADLSYADLSGAWLIKVDLSNADLSNVDLKNAHSLKFETLKACISLYQSKGLPDNLMIKLKQEKPAIFERVESDNVYDIEEEVDNTYFPPSRKN